MRKLIALIAIITIIIEAVIILPVADTLNSGAVDALLWPAVIIMAIMVGGINANRWPHKSSIWWMTAFVLLPLTIMSQDYGMRFDKEMIAPQVNNYPGETHFVHVRNFHKSNGWNQVGQITPVASRWMHIKQIQPQCVRAHVRWSGHFGESAGRVIIPTYVTYVLIDPHGKIFSKVNQEDIASNRTVFYRDNRGIDPNVIKWSDPVWQQACNQHGG